MDVGHLICAYMYMNHTNFEGEEDSHEPGGGGGGLALLAQCRKNQIKNLPIELDARWRGKDSDHQI